MNSTITARLLVLVTVQVFVGLASLLQGQAHSAVLDNDLFRLYYRFPTFCQQLALILGIVLSVCTFILLLSSVSNPFSQIVVYYEVLMIVSKIVALRLDGVANIPHLKKKVCWGVVYFLFFIHHMIEYFEPPLQSELKVQNESKLYLLTLLVSVMLLVLSVVSSLYRPYKDQVFRPPAEYTCDLIEYVSFAYNNELIELGRKLKSLKLDHVPSLSDGDSSKVLSGQFNTILQSLPDSSKEVGYSSLSGPIADDSSISGDENTPSGNNVAGMNLLARSLFLLIWKEWLQQSFFQLIGSLSMFLSPLALETMLLYVKYQGNEQYIKESFLHIPITTAVALLFLAPFFKSIGDGGNYVRGRHIGIRVKGALICAIYSKALRVDLTATKESIGRLMNLMSVDVSEIQEFCSYSHFLWSTPLEIIIASGLLFVVLGSASFAGVAVMVLAIVAGYYVCQWMEKYQDELLKNKDKRMEIINEVLQSIRIIKYFAWEKNFAKKINHIRGIELTSLLLYSFAGFAMYIIWEAVPCLVGVVAFLTYTKIQGEALPVSVGFTGMVLFNLLRFPLGVLPDMINAYVRAKISLQRVHDFLSSPDVEGLPMLEKPVAASEDIEIELTNVMTAWNVTSAETTYEDRKGEKKSEPKRGSQRSESCCEYPYRLCSIIRSSLSPSEQTYELLDSNSSHGSILQPPAGVVDKLPSSHRIVLRSLVLRIPHNSFTVIIGTTGSGKTSLLQGSILGEAITLSGSRYCGGRISYSSQTSWIQNATLRENILFGETYEAERYERIVQACALVEDFEQFPANDLTEIGEKGVNLSGGQSQRVNLARASYAKSDIILMDDPLSAVDSKVAEHIFQHLILKELKDRTRVLVTHNLSLVLPHAEHIVILDEKEQRILCQGSVAEILKHLDLRLLSEGSNRKNEDEVSSGFLQDIHNVLELKMTDRSPIELQLLSPSPLNRQIVKSPHIIDDEEHPEDGNSKSLKASIQTPGIGQLVDEEKKEVGDVPLSVYWFYLSAGGGIITTIVLTLSCLWIAGSWFAQNYFLGQWMQAMEAEEGGGKSDEYNRGTALGLYLISVMSVFAAYFFRSLVKIAASMKASKEIHERLLRSILLATCSWFEATPTGRIISRFSQDVSTLDSRLMNHILDFTDCLIGTIQVVTVIGYVMPLLLLPLLPVLVYTSWVTYQYLCISRELKRLESISKSPVFILFSETLNGLPIIRAFQQEKRFYGLCCDRVDDMNRCHLYLWICNRWLNFRMQMLGALVAGVVGMGVVYYTEGAGRGGSGVTASAAGLALLYSMGFCDNLTFLARLHAETQMDLNCIERIREYSDVSNEKYNMTVEELEAFTVNEESVRGGSGSSMIHRCAKAVPCIYTLVELFRVLFSSHDAEEDDGTSGEGEGLEFRVLNIHSDSSTIRSPFTSDKRASSWPSEGNVRFEKVVLQYPSASSPVLNEVSFNIAGGKKVGVCGRSGAGKSSLIVALFRIVEASGGSIMIDGRDIQSLPLYELRKNIAIVPQDPTLFKGTLRFNLDPFTEYSDEDMLSVLRTVQLYEVMKRLSQSPSSSSSSSASGDVSLSLSLSLSPSPSPQLSYGSDENILDRVMIAEKGGNLSVGQRQLLCMARAILRKPKILILDECTASIDHETDGIIQNVVRSQLSECTVISIAHRLHTIAYYDAVIVMQQGRMMEYDHPYKLMRDSDSLFHKMCKVSGAYEELLSIASQQFQANSQ